MTERRFDTNTLLSQLLRGEECAFQPFYERYRGRVYRFIVRQCGNGEAGRQAYLSAWARLVNSRDKCGSSKDLKFAFFKNLVCPVIGDQKYAIDNSHRDYLPKGLDEEKCWSMLLVEQIRRLPDGLRKRFLFRFEMGLSGKAVATIFAEGAETTKGYLREAEQILMTSLVQAGYHKKVPVEVLYRETRFLKPPTSWDEAVLGSYKEWLSQGVPAELLQHRGGPLDKSLKGRLRKTLGHFKNDLFHKFPHSFSTPRS